MGVFVRMECLCCFSLGWGRKGGPDPRDKTELSAGTGLDVAVPRTFPNTPDWHIAAEVPAYGWNHGEGQLMVEHFTMLLIINSSPMKEMVLAPLPS